jgi:CRISPR-associated protein Cas1
MSTLYIDRKNVHLEYGADALVFHENGERIGTIPLAPLQRIVVRGNVSVDTSLLGKLGAHGIGLIVLSGRRAEPSLFLPRPHNDAERRLAQYRAATQPDTCLAIARDIVQRKLHSQHGLLQSKLDTRPEARYELSHSVRGIGGMLGHVASQPDLAALRGLEGAAANLYFAAFAALVPASLGFHGRNRRPPRDPANAVLSLAYTLLHSEAILAAHAAGLDPAIGFFHQTSFGRESLASDLVEAHRAEVDSWVLQLFNEQTLRTDNFSSNGEGCLLGKAGRAVFYKAWEPVAEHLRRALDRQTRSLIHTLLPESPQGDDTGLDETGFDDTALDAPTIHPAPPSGGG